VKYIEQVKSISLTLLVFLSIALTFFIWTYTPNYELIEQSEIEEVTIGEKKEIVDVLKPYKLLYRLDNEWKGTVSATAMDGVMKSFSQWKVTDLLQVEPKLTVYKLNDMISEDNRFTLFFMGNVPLRVFQEVLPFNEQDLPEITFNRMIVDWDNYRSKELYLFFINTEEKSVYRGTVRIPNGLHFIEELVEPAKEYGNYQEIERTGAPSLFAVDEPVETIKYTYYIDETKPELFRNVLFADPNLVQRNEDSTQSEKYTDGMSLMTVDTISKTINYVYPAAESSASIAPSKLLQNSFDFVNEHGGITDDYRIMPLTGDNHQIDYLMFLQGLPVVSYETTTRLSTIWGDNRIFRYKRPYYSLEMDITSEKEIKALPSGLEVIQWINTNENLALLDLDEIVVGYYLSKSENQNLYTLEPSWFYVQDGNLFRITPEMLGGVISGLE